MMVLDFLKLVPVRFCSFVLIQKNQKIKAAYYRVNGVRLIC